MAKVVEGASAPERPPLAFASRVLHTFVTSERCTRTPLGPGWGWFMPRPFFCSGSHSASHAHLTPGNLSPFSTLPPPPAPPDEQVSMFTIDTVMRCVTTATTCVLCSPIVNTHILVVSLNGLQVRCRPDTFCP